MKLKEEQYRPRLLGCDASLCILQPNYGEEVQAVSWATGQKVWSGQQTGFDGYALAGGVWVTRQEDRKNNKVDLIASDCQTGKLLWQKPLLANNWISVNDKRVAVLSQA